MPPTHLSGVAPDRRSESARRRLAPGWLGWFGAVFAVTAALMGCSPDPASPQPTASESGAPNLERVDPETGDVIDVWPLIAEIPVGAGFGRVALDGGEVWVLNSTDQTLSRIDASAAEVVTTIALDAGNEPGDLVLAAGDAWVTDPAGDAISRVDGETDDVVAQLPAEHLPTGLVVADGDVWVANHHGPPSGSVWRLDADSGDVIARIPLGASTLGPQWMAASAGSVWVGVPSLNAVARIGTQNNTVTATIDVPDGGVCGNLVADDVAVWVTPGFCGEGAVVRIDPQTDAVTARIASPLWNAAFGGVLAFGSLWLSTDRGIFEIDPSTAAVIGHLTFDGRDAFGGDLAADDSSLWVHDGINGTVVRVGVPD